MFGRLIPILLVANPSAERDWYRRLGFEVSYAGPEYPDFIALRGGEVEFGVERRDGFDVTDPNRVLVWQFGVPDVNRVAEHLQAEGLAFDEEWCTPRPDWKYRVLHTRSPNGYHVAIEGKNEDYRGIATQPPGDTRRV